MKILKTASLGSNLTGSYKKECILFLYSLKIAENQTPAYVFRGLERDQ